MGAIWQDLRFAWRGHTRHPAFALVAVATLAVAIGFNSAVFSLVNAVLLQPLPVSAPEKLVRIYSSVPGEAMGHAPMAFADLEDMRQQVAGLADLAAYAYTPLAAEHDGESRLVMASLVSGNFFALLGLEAERGRVFTPHEAPPDRLDTGPPLAVLSHTAWQRRFGGAEGIVGQTFRLNSHPFTVVGIAPRSFHGLTRGVTPELWLPLGTHGLLRGATGDPAPPSAHPRSDQREPRWLWGIGRLTDGASVEQVQAEATALADRLRHELPETHSSRDFATLPANRVRILPGVDAGLQTASWIVLGVVGLVLLIAAANLANLLLARSLARRRELSVRLALGAGRGAVFRLLLAESLLLAFAGGSLGLLLAVLSNTVLNAWRPSLPVDLVLGLALDSRVLLFTFGIAASTAILFSLAPAFELARVDLQAYLRTGGDAGGRSGRPWRHALVVAQVAISLLLLVCAGLATRSLANAHRIDPGFVAEGAVVATFAPHLQGYSGEQSRTFYHQLGDTARALPGVTAAGFTSHLPLTYEMTFERLADADAASEPAGEEAWQRVDSATVSPGYFAAMGLGLRQGRGFATRDTAESPRVAVVNANLAERLWPEGNALGRRLHLDGVEGDYEVVGVAQDGRYRTLGELPRPFLYTPLAQKGSLQRGHAGEIHSGSRTLVVRVDGDPAQALPAIRQVVRRLDDQLAVHRLTTLDDAIGTTLLLPRFVAALFALFGGIGLLLATLGIYGVMAYWVGRRRREIGIRRAIGARRRDIVRLVGRQSARLIGLGVALGLLGAWVTTRYLSAILYGVDPTDGLTLAGVTLVLSLAAFGATTLPARHAARVEPVVALREE